MGSDSISDHALDVLLKEHSLTCSQIHQMTSYTDKMLGAAVAVVSAALLYGIKENVPGIVIALPYVSVALLLYFSAVYTSVFSLGGYRRYLETQINSIVNRDLLRWELVASRVLHTSIAGTMLMLYLLTAYCVLSFFGWSAADTLVSPWLRILVKAGYVAGAALVTASIATIAPMHRKAQVAAAN
jgi:hypothetical protein